MEKDVCSRAAYVAYERKKADSPDIPEELDLLDKACLSQTNLRFKLRCYILSNYSSSDNDCSGAADHDQPLIRML